MPDLVSPPPPTVLEKINRKNIILASQSPRRKELLASLDIIFTTISLDVSESYPLMPAERVPIYLAQKKANAYVSLTKNDLLITADTIVISEGRVLNKPKNIEEAFAFLNQLQGKSHQVMTGVCLKKTEKEMLFSCTTTVFFRSLALEDIHYYLKKSPPLDKAGGYGIQDWIGKIGIEKIEGDYYNVMGLPLSFLYANLKEMV